MEFVSGQNLRDIHVVLDGRHFQDCVLENCVLEYSGGLLTLERTEIRECQYHFGGQARATVQFLRTVGLMQGDPSVWFDMPETVH